MNRRSEPCIAMFKLRLLMFANTFSNRGQYFCQTLKTPFVKRWKHFCQTLKTLLPNVENTFVKRWKTPLSNVGKHLCQTLDNTLINDARLRNITQHRYVTYSSVFAILHLVVRVADGKMLMCGRLVVETKAIGHHLKYCASSLYTIVVVEWSKFCNYACARAYMRVPICIG